MYNHLSNSIQLFPWLGKSGCKQTARGHGSQQKKCGMRFAFNKMNNGKEKKMEYFGHMGFGGIMWIVIIGLVFYLGFVLMRTGGDVRGSDSALEILKKRYAAGEISEEDFKRMKNELLGR